MLMDENLSCNFGNYRDQCPFFWFSFLYNGRFTGPECVLNCQERNWLFWIWTSILNFCILKWSNVGDWRCALTVYMIGHESNEHFIIVCRDCSRRKLNKTIKWINKDVSECTDSHLAAHCTRAQPSTINNGCDLKFFCLSCSNWRFFSIVFLSP